MPGPDSGAGTSWGADRSESLLHKFILPPGFLDGTRKHSEWRANVLSFHGAATLCCLMRSTVRNSGSMKHSSQRGQGSGILPATPPNTSLNVVRKHGHLPSCLPSLFSFFLSLWGGRLRTRKKESENFLWVHRKCEVCWGRIANFSPGKQEG